MDANNLYGHSMMQLLPTEILAWVPQNDFNLDHYSNHSPIGCFFDYSDELHDLHNDYPLTFEKIETTKELLSD